MQSIIDTTLKTPCETPNLQTILSVDLKTLLKRKGLNDRLFEDNYSICFEHDIAQHAAWAFRHVYSIPYYSLEAIDNPGGIARFYHGLLHVGRTAMYAPIFATLYRRHGHLQALELSHDALKLIQIALLFHDSAREDEEEDLWDHESGTFLYFYLTRVLKIAKAQAKVLAEAIANKDWNPSEHYKVLSEINGEVVWLLESVSKPKDIQHKLIHDCDCLDIIRARDVFEGKRLYFYQDIVKRVSTKEPLNEMAELIIRARSLIEFQGDSRGHTKPEVKKHFEHEDGYNRLLASIYNGNFALFEKCYANGRLLSSDELACLKLIDDQNILNQQRILARGLIVPTAISTKSLESNKEETFADLEFRKTKRRKNVKTSTSKSNGLDKEGNPNRSVSLLGSSVFADVGCLLFNPDDKAIKAIYAMDADTGWGKKRAPCYQYDYLNAVIATSRFEPNQLSTKCNQITLDKLEKKIKTGGAVRFFNKCQVVAGHNEILCDITQYDAIYYTLDPTFSHKLFHGTAKNTQPYSAILKAIHIQLAYQKALGELLPIYEYSGIHYYLKKVPPFEPQQIEHMWLMMCEHFIRDKIQKGKIKELSESSVIEIMILSMYPKINPHFFEQVTDACHHYPKTLTQRIQTLISEKRDSLIATHRATIFIKLHVCFEEVFAATELTTMQCQNLDKLYRLATLASFNGEIVLFQHDACLSLLKQLEEKNNDRAEVSKLIRIACLLQLMPVIKTKLGELNFFRLIKSHNERIEPTKRLYFSDLIIALDSLVHHEDKIDLAYLTVLEISNGKYSDFVLLNHFYYKLDNSQQKLIGHFFKANQAQSVFFKELDLSSEHEQQSQGNAESLYGSHL